jgi:hypothetical protein
MHVQVLRGGGSVDPTPSQHWCYEVGGQQYILAALPRERTSTHCIETSGPQEQSGQAWKTLLPSGFNPLIVQATPAAVLNMLSWPPHKMKHN